MSESKVAPWLTAISMLAAAAGLGLALYQHNQKELEKEVAQWQRVLIYKIVSEGNGVSFRDLKLRYVTEATQLQSFKLPAKEIQDDALRFNLLDLQKDRLVILGINGTYRPVVDIPDLQRDLIISLVKTESSRKDAYYVQRPKILRLIDKESGRYTTEELYQRVRDEKIDVSEDDFYNLVSSLRFERFVNRDDRGRLWSTHDMEAPESREPPQKKKK